MLLDDTAMLQADTLSSFSHATDDEIHNLISKFSDATCSLDSGQSSHRDLAPYHHQGSQLIFLFKSVSH